MGAGPAMLPVAIRYRQLSFERAARRYDAVSEVQRLMARRLVKLLQLEGESPRHVLELGCGTGHLSELLVGKFPGARLLCTDLSRGMLEQTRRRLGGDGARRVHWLQLDASRVRDGLRARFDLIASSAMVQWLDDLPAHVDGVGQRLRPGGRYLVSGFATDNLPELALALARFDVAPGIGHSREQLERACSAAGLRLVAFQSESIPRVYRDAREFFELLRAMGASRYPGGSPLAPGALRALMRDYGEGNASAHGVHATWRPWYALLSR